MKPRNVSRLSTACMRWSRLGRRPVESNCDIIPHRATRPCGRSAPRAGSKLLSADIVEVDVDAVRRGPLQATGYVLSPVIDSFIESELVHQQSPLGFPAGATDDFGCP